MRVKCLAQGHNTMSQARARTRIARSVVERTNREATAPPMQGKEVLKMSEFDKVIESEFLHCKGKLKHQLAMRYAGVSEP